QALLSTDDLRPGQRFDSIFLATKAKVAIDVAAQLRHRLAHGGYVVTFQNGYIIDAVAAAVGAENVVGAVTGFTSTMVRPGVYRRTSRGALYVGEPDGSTSERVAALVSRLQSVAPTTLS